jgi:fatty acid desaturase
MNPTLTPEQSESFGAALDAIRADILASRGSQDAAYIRRVIAVQRSLEVGGRLALFAGVLPPFWVAGTSMLAVAKILENMEIGHNVLHGQWDWLRDEEIHSTTWEWDTAAPASQWKHSHNVLHHNWTNVHGMDRDIGYGILRMSEDQRWSPANLGNPVYNLLLASLFQYGVGVHDVEVDRVRSGEKSLREAWAELKVTGRKTGRQVVKDYVAFPALAGPFALPVLAGNATANLARNLWSHAIIFCGHFPDGVQTFTREEVGTETRGQWYVRQLLGSANIDGRALFHLMSGNLSFQIEHHLFPDLPSNRYAEIAPKVRALCVEYGLPYTSGRFSRQYLQVWRRVFRLALPGRATTAAPRDLPARRETVAA